MGTTFVVHIPQLITPIIFDKNIIYESIFFHITSCFLRVNIRFCNFHPDSLRIEMEQEILSSPVFFNTLSQKARN
jgi:hypothetical protein